MKKTFIISAVLLYPAVSAQYCQPVFQYGSDSNMITRVTFGNINQNSPFQSGTTPVYEDFTSLSTDVQAGGNYTISVKGPSSTFPSDAVAFIDFNQNGSFNDAGESFYIGRLSAANPANAFTVTNTITIPANASLGTTRMRILKNSNTAAYSDPNAPSSITTACDASLRAGQAEDYSVNITGSNSVFPAPYCGDQNITTLTVSEISNVEFAGVTRSSTIDGSSATMEDFTSTIFNVNKENSYPISVTGGTHGQTTVSAYAYIDFNHNNAFEAEETFNVGYLDNSNPVSGTDSGTAAGIITIPATALSGQTRFRLVKAYESSSWMGTLENLPCPSGWFIGQVEDYTINILPAGLSTQEVLKESLKIYPNPTTGIVHIKTPDRLRKVEVFSLSGQKLSEGNSDMIDINRLVPGTYLMKVETENQKTTVHKIIKR
ncbi:hypothetical protein HNP38_000667 [Chryseobacterium defluvii]|uniref:Secreted protein (Por secretion system target) n=1 Tax=Chryseobacterium defluvii TaxID=160396 RepID=A0A840KAE5_9FLAO|nr:GEVED domain-containing protein [Chryseobacterium defluvii]MBB4805395.1 hypothetical protein [Chryseobacterium defluvii]